MTNRDPVDNPSQHDRIDLAKPQEDDRSTIIGCFGADGLGQL